MHYWNFRKSAIRFILLLIITSSSAVVIHNIFKLTRCVDTLQAEEAPSEPFFYPAPEQKTSELFQKRDVQYPYTFIVYGDSREPAGYEKDAVIAQIIKEKPSFVIHTGDLVLYGEEHQWKIFDIFNGSMMEKGISFYPVLGNHEYHTRERQYPENPEPQLEPYFRRFKYLRNKRWYSFKYGNSLFVMLDTTTDYSEGSHQYKWLMKTLKEEAPAFLFIAFHYSPYTKEGYKEGRDAEGFLADIFESYKEKGLARADIVFSGHTHNYERYKHKGINYVVTGGGGAPQHSIPRSPEDLYSRAGKTYHYCRITVSADKAVFEMIRLDEDSGKWVAGDTFTVSKE